MANRMEEIGAQGAVQKKAFEAYREETERLATMLNGISAPDDFSKLFLDVEASDKFRNKARLIEETQKELQELSESCSHALSLMPDYEQLGLLHSLLQGSALPLSFLLQDLGSAKAKTVIDRLSGNHAEKTLEMITREHTELRRKLREKARDKTAFDKAFMLSSEQPKAKRSQPTTPKSASPRSQNTARTASPFTGVKAGSVIQFGHYHQNRDGRDSTPIDWRVLKVSGGKALLISEKALDRQQYNTKYTDVTWETCSLRKWMNSTFLNAAFQPEERNRIQNTTVTADKNPSYNTNPGKATTDKVFLLSIPEAEKYFGNNEARRCAPTAYAKAHGAYTNSDYKTSAGEACCWWRLRSPGMYQFCAASVFLGGSVDYGGSNGSQNHLCVRPALWINLDS